MKVLVVGAGGREHAICWKLSQSKLLQELYCAPGNPGMADLAQLVSINVSEIDRLAEFAESKAIDLTVIGPEIPLVNGIVDVFQARGLAVFGPAQVCARLEGSKSFAKEIMEAAGVPTAGWKSFSDHDSARSYLNTISLPVVLKADGLAAGKGVFVCHDSKEVNDGLKAIFEDLGAQNMVVEEFLDGTEASLIVAVGNGQIVPLASSHDYKRIAVGDQGPNTGGMGSVSPTPRLTAAQEQEAIEAVIRPVLRELKKRGLHYKGFLYAGLMLSAEGLLSVLEFNVRLGDPEAQAILRRLDSDFLELLHSLLNGQSFQAEWSTDAAICLVLAAGDYPRSGSYGAEITGISEATRLPGVEVFHAGTSMNEQGKIVTSGGRVLNVTARAASIEQARSVVFQAASSINFQGMQYRSDIARK